MSKAIDLNAEYCASVREADETHRNFVVHQMADYLETHYKAPNEAGPRGLPMCWKTWIDSVRHSAFSA